MKSSNCTLLTWLLHKGVQSGQHEATSWKVTLQSPHLHLNTGGEKDSKFIAPYLSFRANCSLQERQKITVKLSQLRVVINYKYICPYTHDVYTCMSTWQHWFLHGTSCWPWRSFLQIVKLKLLSMFAFLCKWSGHICSLHYWYILVGADSRFTRGGPTGKRERQPTAWPKLSWKLYENEENLT